MSLKENYCKSYFSQCKLECTHEIHQQKLDCIQEISKYRSQHTVVSSLTNTLTTLVNNSAISSPSTTTSVNNSIAYKALKEVYCKSYFSRCQFECAHEIYQQKLECLQEFRQFRSPPTVVSSLTSTLTTLVNNSTIPSTTLPNTTMETIKNMFTAVKGSYDHTVNAVPKTIDTMNTTLILLIILIIIACVTFIILYCICQRMTACTSCCIGCNSTCPNSRKKIFRKFVRKVGKQPDLHEYDQIKMVYENEYLRPIQSAS